MLVLGVDPGSRITGYGLVEKKKSDIIFIHSGLIKSHSKIPFYKRIHKIFQSMVDIIGRYRPEEMAIEDLFYAKTSRALKVRSCQGRRIDCRSSMRYPHI